MLDFTKHVSTRLRRLITPQDVVEALKHRWPIDTFVVYTDSETWDTATPNVISDFIG